MPKPKSAKPRKSSKAPQKKGGAAGQAKGREVQYPDPKVKLCIDNKPVTVTLAKKLLGWEEETEKNKFGSDYVRELFKLYPKKVRCNNNVTNRPLYKAILLTLRQEILRRKWNFNGESVIIGKTGLILNGQHTLIALILAALEVAERPDKWAEYWTNEPTLDKLVVFGIDESDNVVNTMDTCKPRTLADVIYRSNYFAGVASKDRRIASKMADFAIRLMWDRTGAKQDAYAPRRTHSESLDFLERHPKLIKCVEHIFEEDGNGQISQYISSGTAAGLLYLMASAASDPADYQSASNPDESMLDWKLWSKACDFFVLLAGNSPEMLEVNKAQVRAFNADRASHTERCALLVKAWLQYLTGKPITAKDLKLEYKKDKDGYDRLEEFPSVGGIDYGKSPEAEDADEPSPEDPTPEEIESGAKETREKRQAKEQIASKPAKKKKPSGRGIKLIGKMAWVNDSGGNHWRGKVVEASGKNARLKVANGFQGAGNLRTALVSDLRAKQPA